MSRILALDFGSKRTGIAVTDPLQIIASALDTLHTKDTLDFLKTYFESEEVSLVIIGWPTHIDGNPTHATPLVQAFINRFKKIFPLIPIEKVDESYSSKNASKAMIEMGMKKKDRAQKGQIDKIAATIILQEYLQEKQGYL